MKFNVRYGKTMDGDDMISIEVKDNNGNGYHSAFALYKDNPDLIAAMFNSSLNELMNMIERKQNETNTI